ncbi:hypothetical protein [Candidatus Liberibacter brunswickensis]|uniref:hypothetical protein n=1 Tax=Candidatus Liberibacter brunswickensis TaxID=1968796 RepID=UPI002FE2C6FE
MTGIGNYDAKLGKDHPIDSTLSTIDYQFAQYLFERQPATNTGLTSKLKAGYGASLTMNPYAEVDAALFLGGDLHYTNNSDYFFKEIGLDVQLGLHSLYSSSYEMKSVVAVSSVYTKITPNLKYGFEIGVIVTKADIGHSIVGHSLAYRFAENTDFFIRYGINLIHVGNLKDLRGNKLEDILIFKHLTSVGFSYSF